MAVLKLCAGHIRMHWWIRLQIDLIEKAHNLIFYIFSTSDALFFVFMLLHISAQINNGANTKVMVANSLIKIWIDGPAV